MFYCQSFYKYALRSKAKALINIFHSQIPDKQNITIATRQTRYTFVHYDLVS